MRARLCVEKPDEIPYTVTITATAKEWEGIRDELAKASIISYPATELRRFIDDLLSQARKIYWSDE